MSAAVGSDRVDPNMTPLLDVVLQLIMFFMITVNFVSEQINQNVQLPTSQSAQELMAKGEGDVLVINIEVARKDKIENGQAVRDSFGRPVKELVGPPKITRIIFTGTDVIEFKEGEESQALGKAQTALRKQADIFKVSESRRLNKKIDDIKELMPVVIRADVDTHYGLVFPLIAQCNKEGFSKVELRALSKTKK